MRAKSPEHIAMLKDSLASCQAKGDIVNAGFFAFALAESRPAVESAVVVARVISKRLRRAGYTMADTRDRHKWTDGLIVRRVGDGRYVAINYHSNSNSKADEARQQEVMGQVKEFLEKVGYLFDPTKAGLWIECRSH